jgi:hypothetical protein
MEKPHDTVLLLFTETRPPAAPASNHSSCPTPGPSLLRFSAAGTSLPKLPDGNHDPCVIATECSKSPWWRQGPQGARVADAPAL